MQDAENRESTMHGAQRKILIVEDDRSHRTLMEKILKEFSFGTDVAENGTVAVAKLDGGQYYDLILMDWDMPEMNGLETAGAIRKREVEHGRPHIPIVAFTANREEGDREKCLAAGMDAYLPKDVWTPKWRGTLLDNLQGLIAGDFQEADFEEPQDEVDLLDIDAFDNDAFEQTAALLKDELVIAVKEYLEDAARYIGTIQDGVANDDLHVTAQGSHPLKSNSKGFGLIAVASLAEAINKNAREEDMQSVKNVLPQLEQAFQRGEARLYEALKKHNDDN